MSRRERLERPRGGLVWALAWKDMWHETLLSLCLIIALAGVLAPSLVLFGLKSGVISAMRAELVEDPIFRELRPKETQNYDQAFFDAVRARPETQFMAESVLRGASVLRIEALDADGRTLKGENLDMLPTAADDPLLVSNQTVVPGPGEVVLSTPAAEALGVGIGDNVRARVQRNEAGSARGADADMLVVGILPLKGDVVRRVYVPVAFALDVESYREGFGVPARGWTGNTNAATPAYDGVVVALDRPLSVVEQGQLTVNSGFFTVREMTAEAFVSRFGTAPPDRPVLYDISVIERAATEDSVTRVRRRLVEQDARLFPYVKPILAQVTVAAPPPSTSPEPPSGPRSGPGDAVSTVALQLDLRPLPDDDIRPGALRLSEAMAGGLADGTQVLVTIDGPTRPVTFPAFIEIAPEDVAGGAAQMALSRLAVLRRLAERDLIYSPETGEFLLERPGYRGFRLYARSIDDVEGLMRLLESLGVETNTEIGAILRIKALDEGLSRLFWLIAALSFAAGALVLLASQYGAVERKQGALAHLRLIGLSRAAVGTFPLAQGLILAGISAATGLALAYAAQVVINTQFAVPLGFDRRMCVISAEVALLAAGGMMLVSALISLMAAHRATAIDPAEGIRHE